MDPYKVLEINRNATDEEIKAAYKRLAKKYHPDMYNDNPLKELAEEKLREVNQAYDMLMRNKNRNAGSSGSSTSYSQGRPIFNDVRVAIQRGDYRNAERLLHQKQQVNTAEYHYLKGVIEVSTGRYNSGIREIDIALQMDPNNPEYLQAKNEILSAQNNMFARGGDKYMTQQDVNRQLCQCMQCYCCMDACCDCI